MKPAQYKHQLLRLVSALCLAVMISPAVAGEVDVVATEAERQSDGKWRFSVTLLHDDEGWDHYADRWDVVGPDGTVYGERVLAHPHENEQPFTRSLPGVSIPEGVTTVTIRGHDNVHGLGGKELVLELK
ncbi:hypothetical protein [Hoeflea prorocentri]|uniref:Uncharacterized protein n=1 Tax=Hoeflea prorocentri TaxID=1922333 RepID=A0A9X3ZGM2_9HYPH|nr:hypothetical protein [Hoeflea prorocentri]MCY6380922.1 hypothetical protein [Hoeflea prorocentri]MDA5398722.1 hypothetical protein [Hoeflea prorocentri]